MSDKVSRVDMDAGLFEMGADAVELAVEVE